MHCSVIMVPSSHFFVTGASQRVIFLVSPSPFFRPCASFRVFILLSTCFAVFEGGRCPFFSALRAGLASLHPFWALSQACVVAGRRVTFRSWLTRAELPRISWCLLPGWFSMSFHNESPGVFFTHPQSNITPLGLSVYLLLSSCLRNSASSLSWFVAGCDIRHLNGDILFTGLPRRGCISFMESVAPFCFSVFSRVLDPNN